MKPIVTTSRALVAILASTTMCNADAVRKGDRSPPSEEAVYDDGPHGPERCLSIWSTYAHLCETSTMEPTC